MEIKELVIPLLEEKRNYWLVRTEGGLYYEDFSLNDFIAISWNEIDSHANTNEFSKKDIYNTLKNVSPYNESEESKEKLKRNSNRIANTINKFIFEIKKGDIVMIPSQNSSQINFGEVLEDQIYYDKGTSTFEEDNIEPCPYIKRRKIKWLKKVHRRNLDPKLFSLFYSHHTISMADKKTYASYIDRTIDSLFIKGENAHLVLEVTNTNDINAYTFSSLIQNSIKLVDSLSLPLNENLNGKLIKVKANVQSPGPIELFGPIKEILLLAAFVVPIYEKKYINFIIRNYKEKRKEN